MLKRLLIAGVAVLSLTACDGSIGSILGFACTSELRIDLQPRGEQQIDVGSGFTPSVELSSCGGREQLSDTFSWSAQDTAIARVDPSTGRVTGRSPGSTLVEVQGRRYGRLATIPVIVR